MPTGSGLLVLGADSLELIELAEPGRRRHPWEVILSSLPASQRRIAKIDDAAAASILDSYNQSRQIVIDRIKRRYERTFAKGVTPTQGQLYHFALDGDIFKTLEERQREIAHQSAYAIESGYEAAIEEALARAAVEQRAIEQTLKTASTSSVLTGSFVVPPGVAEEVGIAEAIRHANSVAAEIPLAVQKVLTATALAGEGVNSMVARTTPLFNGNARRAELTSRYTVIRAYNVAREYHYQNVAEVLEPFKRSVKKMWATSVDDRACPVCLALHGSIVDLEGSFDTDATFSSAKPPPSYPEPDSCETPPRHARCRCSLVPWVEGWRAGTDFTPEAMQAEARRQALKELKTIPASVPPPDARVVPGPSPFSGTSRAAKSITGADLRAIPNSSFDSALAAYRACSLG